MRELTKARIRSGWIEPAEPVQLSPDGTEVILSLKETDRANEWFKELHTLFAPVRVGLGRESEEAIHERIVRAVKTAGRRSVASRTAALAGDEEEW